MNPTGNDMAPLLRAEINRLLNQRLADAVNLQMRMKQAHWNVKGSSFIALHELFDQVSEAVENHVDMIAERIVQFDGIADGSCAPPPPALGWSIIRWRLPMAGRMSKPSRRDCPPLGMKSAAPSIKGTNWGTLVRPTCSPRCCAAWINGCDLSRPIPNQASRDLIINN